MSNSNDKLIKVINQTVDLKLKDVNINLIQMQNEKAGG